MTSELITFILVVGIGSTIVLDLWGVFTAKIGWIPGTHWPSVGRWILGLLQGRLVYDAANKSPFTTLEAFIGWTFHYGIGIAYAVFIPLFWGVGYISNPTVSAPIVIGVIVSTLAGLAILMPGMGAGFFAMKTPKPSAMIVYVVLAHVVFAIGQYVLALAVA